MSWTPPDGSIIRPSLPDGIVKVRVSFACGKESFCFYVASAIYVQQQMGRLLCVCCYCYVLYFKFDLVNESVEVLYSGTRNDPAVRTDFVICLEQKCSIWTP